MLHSFDIFQPYPELTAGYTDRHGGASQGNYASFNCHYDGGDDPMAVAANRNALERSLGMSLITAHQVHGTDILHVDRTFGASEPAERERQLQGKDALITAEPGLLVGIHTADCIPLLLYDPKERICAAIHAGWRGTAANIAGRTIHLLTNTYHCRPENLLAAIGPGISLSAFEVGDEVYEAFDQEGYDMHRIAQRFSPASKWHLDLKAANRDRLVQYGIPESHIEDAGICTWQNTDYFSARRMGIRSGRILSCIGIKE